MIFIRKRPFWPALLCPAVLFCRLLASGAPDMTQIQCGNLIYQGTKSSVCFADRFLGEASRQTNLRVAKNFYAVKLDSDALFDTPFCVFSGDKSFVLTQRERDNLKKYLLNGG